MKIVSHSMCGMVCLVWVPASRAGVAASKVGVPSSRVGVAASRVVGVIDVVKARLNQPIIYQTFNN